MPLNQGRCVLEKIIPKFQIRPNMKENIDAETPDNFLAIDQKEYFSENVGRSGIGVLLMLDLCGVLLRMRISGTSEMSESIELESELLSL